MKRTHIGLVAGAGLAALAGCTVAQNAKVNTALSSPQGQLFCAVVIGGSPIIMGVVQTASAAVGPAGEAAALLATGATSAFVQNACKQAAANVGGTAGAPVSPPANPAAVPLVAVDPAKIAG
jgi:branched-subunit amino acid ABC-type transport system permease component